MRYTTLPCTASPCPASPFPASYLLALTCPANPDLPCAALSCTSSRYPGLAPVYSTQALPLLAPSCASLPCRAPFSMCTLILPYAASPCPILVLSYLAIPALPCPSSPCPIQALPLLGRLCAALPYRATPHCLVLRCPCPDLPCLRLPLPCTALSCATLGLHCLVLRCSTLPLLDLPCLDNFSPCPALHLLFLLCLTLPTIPYPFSRCPALNFWSKKKLNFPDLLYNSSFQLLKKEHWTS